MKNFFRALFGWFFKKKKEEGLPPPKRTRPTKADINFRHARRRALERYGLIYDESLLAEIRSKMMNRNYLERRKQTKTRSFVCLLIDDQKVRFIWDKKHKSVVTFLPPEPEAKLGDLFDLSSLKVKEVK